jgi:D-glycerate 3-kinase
MTFSNRWPTVHIPLSVVEIEAMADRLTLRLAGEAARAIGSDLRRQMEAFYIPLAAWLARTREGKEGPLVVGLNGAQGSGKSTLSRLLQDILRGEFGLRAAGFSLDDLYLTRAERERLARTVHPLLATRGVPGTHDVELGLRTIQGLKEAGEGNEVPIPAFDKGRDDRCPKEEWTKWRGEADLVIFEGWCVGAVPQPEGDLDDPVNDLERRDDPDGSWRRWVNGRLADGYYGLFAGLDLLIMLQVPGMDSVFRWRGQQERQLAEEKGRDLSKLMDEQALRRFIMHYERLTRHMLEEMPGRADVVLRLNENHAVDGVRLTTKSL